MSQFFESGRRLSAGQLNEVAALASEANQRAASWLAFNNGDALVTRSPRRDLSASPALHGSVASGWPKVATVVRSGGTTVQVRFGDSNATSNVYILNSTGRTRLERNQNILVHAVQLQAIPGTYDESAAEGAEV